MLDIPRSALALALLLAAPANATGDDGPAWLPTFGPKPNLGVGYVRASAVYDDGGGAALFLGGDFHEAGLDVVDHVVWWDGVEWSPLLSGGVAGVDGPVYALCAFDDGTGARLYVGGDFQTAGGMPARGLARWDGTVWSPVSGGVDGAVRALVVHDDGSGPALYVGGTFTQAGDVRARALARWDGTSWSAVEGRGGGIGATGVSGLPSAVQALCVGDVRGGQGLFVGGSFDEAGGHRVRHVARWDGAAFSPLGLGVGGKVNALCVSSLGGSPELFVGGDFDYVGGHVPAANVARYGGGGWAPLGLGVSSSVYALREHELGAGPELLVGGKFEQVDGGPFFSDLSYLARWHGAGWSALPARPNGPVHTLATFDEGQGAHLFAGGGMGAASGAWIGVQRLEGAAWTMLGSGLNKPAHSLFAFEGELLVGGSFDFAGGKMLTRVGRWDGASWSAMGSGANLPVTCWAVFDEGAGPALFAGGGFTFLDGTPIRFVARWDGAGWSQLGGGLDAFYLGGASDLTVFDDGTGPALYAVGNLQSAGSLAVNNIARWDGSAWSSVGGGLPGGLKPTCAAVFDDGAGQALYVAGDELLAGSTKAVVVRWDGGAWTQIGVSAGWSSVQSMTVFDDGSGAALYVGGDFTDLNGVPLAGLARWDGVAWSDFGGGFDFGIYDFGVRALAVVDAGDGAALCAGGDFSGAGGVPANGIARWDGAAWTPLGAGVGEVYALAGFDDGTGQALYAAGSFEEAPDSGDAYLARFGFAAVQPIPGCHGNSATLSPLAPAAKLGAAFPVELTSSAIASGTAYFLGGQSALDAAGCGPFVAGLGELLLGAAPASLGQASMTGGAATLPLVVPSAPALVGSTVDLGGVAFGTAPLAVELTNGLAVRILH